jgi:uncharacterized protein (TIGR02444 family)
MAIDEIQNGKSLWDFSCAFYAKPSVAACCLQLQDEQGVNINVLLWSLWLEGRHIVLTAEILSSAIMAIGPFDKHYVQSLRKIRRQLSSEFAQNIDKILSLKKKISEAELLAEKIILEELEALSSDLLPSENKMTASKNKMTASKNKIIASKNKIIAGTNLNIYLKSMKIPRVLLEQVHFVFGIN